MRSAVAIIASLCLSSASAPLMTLDAQAAPPPTNANPWTEVELTSATLKEKRTLRIALPDDYATSTRHYPVLVILDAGDTPQFTAAISTVRFLAAQRAIQPLIIVGVTSGSNRVRDLSPPPIEPVAGMPSDFGGGAAFFEFLHGEVLPLARSRFRAAPYTVFAGHSLGGLMGTYFAAMHPGAFNAIIAMSPSLWVYNGQLIEPYAKATSSAKVPLRLFATSGGHEPSIDLNMAVYAAQLRRVPSPMLAFGTARYPDDTHGLTPMASLADGLRFVFAPVSLSLTISNYLKSAAPDSTLWMEAFNTLESRYLAGAREVPPRALGLPSDLLPEIVYRQSATTVSNVGPTSPPGQLGAAHVIASRYLSNYPASSRAHTMLGDVLLKQRDTTGARTAFTRAVALAQAPSDTTALRLATERLASIAAPAGSGRR